MEQRPQRRVTRDDTESVNAFREKSKKEKQNKKKIILVGVAMLGFMIVAFVIILIFFRVNSITVVQNSSKYTDEELLLAGGISNGNNLLFFNSELAKDKIMETYSYVEDVNFIKHFPATLEIEVVTAEICYNFLNGDVPTYASGTGRVLESGTTVSGEFTDVKSGAFTVEENYIKFEDTTEHSAFYEIAKSLESTDITKISEIDTTNIYQIRMLYDDRVEMELGDAIDLEEKINFGLGIFEKEGIREDEKGVLDLTFATESNKAYFANSANEKDETQEITRDDSEDSQEGEDGEESEESEEGEEGDDSTSEDEEESQSSVDENLPQRGDDIPDV